MAALIISDRPNGSMFENKDGKLAVKPGAADAPPRLFVGKSRDRASVVMLQDANGIPRLMLRVDPDGTSSIDFIDEKGEVLRSIGPED